MATQTKYQAERAKQKENFLKDRTSWKFFDRRINQDKKSDLPMLSRVLLEILKELQYTNDRRED